MPRKKRTRAGRTKLSRPAKLVEKQLEDLSDVSMCSMISEGNNSKEEMLAIFLQEFDNGVENRIKQLRAMMNKAITDQRNLLKMELLKIPKEIREMKVIDFLDAGGNIDTLVLNEANDVVQDALNIDCVQNPMQEPKTGNATTNTNRKSTRTRGRIQATKTPSVAQTEGRVTRGAKKRLMLASQQTPAVDQKAMKFTTPALGNPSLMSHQFKTPLITPKFDPSQPMTTGRRPKRGETLLSLAGSPVSMLPPGANSKSVLLSIEDGQSPKLTGSILDMSPNSLINQQKNILKLKNILDAKIQQIGKERK